MNKAIFVLLAALAYGASAGEVLSGDAAKAKFPAAVQAMQLSETKWSQLMTGVEYGFTHADNMYGVPDDLHVLKIDYAKAPIKMKILEHSPSTMRTSEAAAAANALFAINGTMYNTSVGKPIYNHKVDGRVVTPESGNLPTKVQGLAFNPDKSFDFSGTATLTFADWDNIISCDCLLSKGVNMMDSPEFAWAKNTPGAGYPLIGMTPEKVLVILVIDGRRTGISQGINYFNSAELLKEFGCTEGILYDGGGSTTLAMRNDIVPATDFARTQVVPDYCDGYTLMNYVNTKNNVWEERAVIDQIAFVADDTPTVRNEFRVTPYVQHPATNAITLKFLTTTNTAATISWWPQGNAGAAQSATVSPRLAEELQYYGDHHTLQYLPEMTPWQYRYRIENLAPDTVYEYKVELTGGASYEKHFRTAPATNRPIRFVCYSDCETEPGSNGSAVTWDNYAQDHDEDPSATSRKYFVDQTVGYASNICTMVSRQPDFFVIAGDLAQTGSCQTHWDEFWRHNAGALNDPAGSIPILAALGNHEYSDYKATAGGTAQPGEQGALKYLSYFEFEPNGANVAADQQQRFHRVDYGPVALIFIDPNNGPDNEPPAGTPWSWGWEYAHPHERDTNAQLYEHRIDGGVDKSSRVPQFQEGSAQYQWLEEQLADAQTNKLFTFLVCHQCPFSAGYHGRASGELGRGVEDENLSGVPTRCLTNLVFKYGVDGWICGHDEMYEHSQVQGEETLPDGTKRPMTLNVWDVGIGGDGLRGCRISENPNPYEVFRAHVDAPEVYDNGDWQTGTLVSGGKHYGHLEVNVDQNEEGLWTATLTPVYNFVSKNAQTGALTFERRTYPDEVVVTNRPFSAEGGDTPGSGDPEEEEPVDPPQPEEPDDETVIYVSPTGDGTAPHRGYETGYANIQTAIDAAKDGDTIFVGEGTYGFVSNSDNWAVNVSNAVKVIATGAREKTIIDCTKAASATNDQKNRRGGFYLTSEGAMISGFTVTNAYAMVKSWGPLCGATAGVVTNCYIHAPKSWLGASIGLSGTARGSEIELAPCTYTCSYYDGLYLVDLNNSAVLDRLKLVGATITYSQGNAFVRVMGNGVLRNSIIANNVVDIPSNANNGKFVQVDSNGRIESCTIADNTTNGGKGIVFVNSNTAVITNTVVWGNVCNAGCLCEIYGGSGSGYGLNRFFGSCAAQLTDGVRGNISCDPQFTDAANGDYEPKITSPTLDLAGTPDWAVVDAIGNARVVGEGMDLGAVECRTDKSNVPLSCTISRNVDKGATPLEVTFTASLAGKQDGIEFVWTFSDGATSTDGPSVKHTFAEPGAHTASVTVRNGSGETDSDTSDVVLALPKTCYVSTTGKNIAPYQNWENASTSIDAAVGLGTEEVVVAPGDYTLDSSECVVKTATFVHSSEGPEVTTIRANSAFGDRRAFSVINDAACVSGFTLTGGHAANYGYSSCLDVSAGVVSNCVIKGIANTSRSAVCYFSGTGSMVDCVIDGKGCSDGNPDGARALLNLNGNAHAERCVFSGLSFTANDIPHAAVILSGADTVLRNSLIHGCTNSTKVISGTKYRYGGGIVIRADGGTVENCTVTANYGTTDMGCGLAIEGSKGKVVNTIVWGNARKPAEGALNPQVYTQSADLATVCSYSCAPELTGGVGNVPDDPKIRTGNHRRFQLHGDSPCVNAGDNSVVPADDVDLLRFGRIYNVTVDMGCYECPAGGLMIRVR